MQSPTTEQREDSLLNNHTELDYVVPLEYPAEVRSDLFNDGQVNWMVKKRHENGLEEAGAVIKIGRRLYLHWPKFVGWFVNRNSAGRAR